MVKRWLASANDAMFGPGSATSFGLFRIIICGLTFINLAMVFLQFDVWFSEFGLVPEKFAAINHQGVSRFGLLNNVTDPGVTLTVYLVTMLAALMATFGFFTRVATVVLFIGVVSLHHRTMDILHSGDTLMRAYLFIVMIGPSGAALSVDRLVNIWKGKESPGHKIISIWPQRMVQIQLAIVYFTTVWQKALGSYWMEGTATWYTSQLREFERFPMPAFMQSPSAVAFTTYFTLIAELAMATLVFAKPLRKWVLLAGVGLHLGIEYSMNIPLFAFIILAGYVCHYDGEEIKAWAHRMGGRFKKLKMTVYTPKGTSPVESPVMALDAMDGFDLVTYEQGTQPAWSSEKDTVRPPHYQVFLRSIGAWFLFPFGLGWKMIMRRAASEEKPSAKGDEACATG